MSHAEQLEDGEVLARLWHGPLVRGDHDEGQIDARGAGEHRAHERFVSGHVDDAEGRAVLESQRREPEIDRDAAALFLREPVGVDASQRADECCLAMIDVPGGAEDHAAVQPPRSQSSYAHSARAPPAPSCRWYPRNSRRRR